LQGLGAYPARYPGQEIFRHGAGCFVFLKRPFVFGGVELAQVVKFATSAKLACPGSIPV